MIKMRLTDKDLYRIEHIWKKMKSYKEELDEMEMKIDDRDTTERDILGSLKDVNGCLELVDTELGKISRHYIKKGWIVNR